MGMSALGRPQDFLGLLPLAMGGREAFRFFEFVPQPPCRAQNECVAEANVDKLLAKAPRRLEPTDGEATSAEEEVVRKPTRQLDLDMAWIRHFVCELISLVPEDLLASWSDTSIKLALSRGAGATWMSLGQPDNAEVGFPRVYCDSLTTRSASFMQMCLSLGCRSVATALRQLMKLRGGSQDKTSALTEEQDVQDLFDLLVTSFFSKPVLQPINSIRCFDRCCASRRCGNSETSRKPLCCTPK